MKAFFGDSKRKPSKKKPKAQSKPKIFAITEESQNNTINDWKDNDDVIKGMEFCATMQLRTPLHVLLRHGEIHTNMNTEPPVIVKEMWEGIWNIQLTSWEELGIDLPELPDSTVSSDIGQIKVEDYLPFLISVRKIVESNNSMESRIDKLRNELTESNWEPLIDEHGGIDQIIGNFFPRFIDKIPKINDATITELSRLGLDTPNRIAAASDETLLGIKGIGQAKIKTIRDFCAGIIDNRDNVRFESVTK